MADTGWLLFTDAVGAGWTLFHPPGVRDYGYFRFPVSIYNSYTGSLFLTNIVGAAAAIPEEAIITGIKVKLSMYGIAYNSTYEPSDVSVYISLDGVNVVGSNRAAGYKYPYYGVVVTNEYGGELDTWNTGGLTRAQLIDPNFSIRYIGAGKSYSTGSRTDLGLSADSTPSGIKIYYTLDRVVTDIGAGAESLLRDINLSVTDSAYSLDYLLNNSTVLVSDIGGAIESAYGGSLYIRETPRVLESVILRKFIPRDDASVAFDTAYAYLLATLDDLLEAVDILDIVVYITLEESALGNDSSDIDYGFSSAVVRMSGSMPSIKFTGYKEEVQ